MATVTPTPGGRKDRPNPSGVLALVTTFAISAVLGLVVAGVVWPAVGLIQATAIGAVTSIALAALGTIGTLFRHPPQP